ncbi:Basic immunoglobulin-like variable motif-containing protein [Trichoplax sp. H2]|nr:Basic immunoglobulin-like variable motif-containing protein [Trichoplax sp. H2]|eukprot:RDD38493.1 Basic immunoglobulin-like variable motif-containing protein [Trichoplax sp. H2]
MSASDAANSMDSRDGSETWILIGYTNEEQTGFHCISWKGIVQDLNTQMPYLYDIRQRYKGIIKLDAPKDGSNNHCLMVFGNCSTRCSDVTKRIL